MQASPTTARQGIAWAAIFTLAVGLALAALAALWQSRSNEALAKERFAALAARAGDELTRRMQLYEYGLRGARGAVIAAGPDRFNRASFQRYHRSRDISSEFPGARGVGLVRRVAAADEAAFVVAARREGELDFSIRQLAPQGGERYVIQYVEPLAGNHQALGLDLASEPSRREAAEMAERSGKATLTRPITVLQASGQPGRAFLLLLPIYADEAATGPLTARAWGWTYAVLVMNEVMQGFDTRGGEFALALRDLAATTDTPFFASAGSEIPAAAGLQHRLQLTIYGRQWELDLRAQQGFVDGLNLRSPSTVALSGSALALLLAVLVGSQAKGRYRDRQLQLEQARRAKLVQSLNAGLEQQVQERTVSLEQALRENSSLMHTIRMQAIVSVADRAGRIIDVNEGFCRISGYGRDELIGQNHRIVKSGLQDAAFWREVWRTISSGKTWRGEVCNRSKDGSSYWVDTIISPFLAEDGRIEKYISIRTDITAAKLLEQRLRNSEAFLDRAGQVAGVGAWQVDLGSQQIHWSAETRRIHEVGPDYQPEMATAINFYPESVRPRLVQAMQEARATGQAWDLEAPLVTAKGRSIWVRVVGEAEFEQGQAVRLVGAFQDITERRRIEAELQQTNERFAMAADAAGIGVWECDVQNRSLRWDAWMYRLYQLEPTDGHTLFEIFLNRLHPDDRQRCAQAIEDALAGIREYDIEFRILLPGGELRHIRAAAQVRRDAEGVPMQLTGVNFNISERKRVELELMSTTSLLRTVLASALDVSLIATDPNLTITVFNAGAENLLGYRSDELLGRATPLLIHDSKELKERAAELTAEFGRPVDGAAVFTDPSTLQQPREWTYVRKDGSRVRVSLVVTAMRDAAGALFGYLGMARDVTQQNRFEASLREAMQSAEQANLAKSQFLANMSHEIRTPMNAVIGLTHLLGRSRLDTQQADLLAKIKLASKSLLAVINDVLDLSKIEAGELMMERSPFSLPQLMADLQSVMSVQAEAKSIGFAIEVPADLPTVINGDAARLHQILSNLLANAIKFTDRGGVCLSVRRLANKPEGVRLRFAVKDSGIGINPEAQQRLFTPFAQADASTTRRFGGTGLGLSIVKRLVDLLGGELGLSSMPGLGSEFWVELDLAVASAEALARQAPPVEASPLLDGAGLQGVRVLVVDDSDINREVARHILELEGAQVSVAGNGLQAFELLRAQPSAFDLVLMDVQMPVLDGHDATERIRNELGLKHLPIIALTAGALASERRRTEVSGMNDFVSKPFEPAALVACMRRHLRPRSDLPALLPASSGQQPGETPTWPEIEGIDAADVRLRLDGDVPLFRQLLRRLLDVFGALAVPAGGLVPAGVQALAGRLHKLRGSAGMLGAKRLQSLAEAAETACRSADTASVAALFEQLQAEIQGLALRVDALPPAPPRPVQPATGTAANPRLLDELSALLQQQSLAALELCSHHAGPLQTLIGAAPYEQLRAHIDDLRFQEALGVLASSRA